jgi:glycosidase
MKIFNIKSIFLIGCSILFINFVNSQDQIERIEPPNWWRGMVHNEIQLLVYGDKVAELNVSLDHPGAMVVKTTHVENPNYLFITLRLSNDIQPGELSFEFSNKNGNNFEYKYPILERTGMYFDEPVNPSDVMYLITPDRFANGNPGNDTVEGMPDKLNRSKKIGRHGGDIEGIINHLDYIIDLGCTAVWLNPVIENDMPRYSYHGYAATDFYQVDARFGTNQEYQELVRQAAEKDIKIVMDMIMNHCGSNHWFVVDPPSKDWLNFGGKYVQTTHKRTTVQDIHASEYDKKAFSDGWFVKTMPDLNQRNPLMAKYLIQNTLWWIEYAKITGIRMDTYPYPDKDFMSDWTCAVQAEYPGYFVVGEEWSLNPAIVSYWQKNKINHDGYTSCLESLMDFPIQSTFVSSLKEKETWGTGWIKVYEMLANDFLYADPDKLVVFPDNHDMARFYTQIENDMDLYKMGIVYFATIRGIPQFYYGTEILMNSDQNPGDHGIIRTDFPGGWDGDPVNGFTGKGLNKKEQEAKAFFTKILNWRKDNEVIHHGKLIQFAPYDGIYSFVRYMEGSWVFVIFNKNKKTSKIDLSRYQEIIPMGSKGKEVITGQNMIMEGTIKLDSRSALIIESVN